MQTGFAAVQQAIEESNARQNAGQGGRLRPLFWKDKERKFVRFLTNDVVTCSVYEYVKCTDGQARDFIQASSLDATQGDWVAQFHGMTEEYGTHKVVPAAVRKMTYGIAVLREEDPESPKGEVRYRDVLEDIEIEDDKGNKKTYPSRVFCTIKAAHGNFWDPVIGYYLRYDNTIADRDYEITRRGDSKGTSYTILPCSPVPDPDLPSVEAVQEFYGYGKPVDPNDEDRYLYCPNTLDEWVKDNASEGRAKHWLTGEVQKSETSTASSNGAVATQQSAPATESAVPSSGADEFHKDTTQNPEAKSDEKPNPAPATETKFAGLRERIQANKEKK